MGPTKLKFLRVLFLALFAGLAGCAGAQGYPTAARGYELPPPTFQVTDLIGTWRDANAMETLIISADRTFHQIYDVPQSGYHHEAIGRWWVEHRQSGCIFVHFDGARFYNATRDMAENGNRDSAGTPISFWDPCESRYVQMPDSVIMRVAAFSSLPHGIRLVHLMWDQDGADKDLRVVDTATPTPVS